MRISHCSLFCVIALLPACGGRIFDGLAGSADDDSSASGDGPGGASGGQGDDSDDPEGDGVGPGEADPNAAPRYAPRLLSKIEYNNTLALILGDTYKVLDGRVDFTDSLPTEAPDASGFLAPPDVSSVSVEGYLAASRQVATAVEPKLGTLLGCEIEQGDDQACIRAFVADFGELLYRRPLSKEDVADHLDFYLASRDEVGQTKPQSALSLLRMMVSSPYFLYQWEEGHVVSAQDGDIVRLNPFQVASRLSFFLWSSGPDRALIELAKSGGLDTDDQVAAQARKMLASQRAVSTIDAFYGQWLNLGELSNLNKNTEAFPEWSPALGAAMEEELRLFTRNVMLKGNATASDLFTSTDTFANAALAKIYGIGGISGQELQPVRLDVTVRAGILTMPAFLASNSGASNPKPFHLGGLMLERFFCQSLTPADPDLIASVPPPQSDPKVVGERAYLEEQTNHPTCAGCHTLMNPLAFGLGNFDALGAFRDEDEHGVPINADANLFGSEFSGPRELAELLAANEEVQNCLTKKWFRFATRHVETPKDRYSIEQARQEADVGELNLRELMLALTTTRSFLYRQLEEGESIP